MKFTSSLPFILLICGMCAPSSLQGQTSPLALEALIGRSYGATSGDYFGDGDGLLLDVTLAGGIHARDAGGLVVAASLSVQGAPFGDGVCHLRPGGAECVPDFPVFALVSLLGGYETSGGKLRGLVGLTRASSDDDAAVGFTGRLDGAVPLFLQLSLIGSARGILIPDFRGDSFRLGGLSLGLRLRFPPQRLP